ncbi:MAG: antitoxin Xre-like helix-turn-helix domain-containing protein [Pseudomonadota bacterium]|nr:antitoxin Xre-like helix-turn-helix domain-containing protein [Pseudomonadota bacterium]MEE3101329.1 antitoxin Xre-like helix-turn-helix domain-containing protein [Pseudomonadota bacterium]
MDHEEFRAGRRRLGLTQGQLGALLGIDARTIRRYETDPASEKQSRPPHPAACAALRWLLGGFRPPEWPADTRPGRED